MIRVNETDFGTADRLRQVRGFIEFRLGHNCLPLRRFQPVVMEWSILDPKERGYHEREDCVLCGDTKVARMLFAGADVEAQTT